MIEDDVKGKITQAKSLKTYDGKSPIPEISNELEEKYGFEYLDEYDESILRLLKDRLNMHGLSELVDKVVITGDVDYSVAKWGALDEEGAWTGLSQESRDEYLRKRMAGSESHAFALIGDKFLNGY
jgi:hypothetical protein